MSTVSTWWPSARVHSHLTVSPSSLTDSVGGDEGRWQALGHRRPKRLGEVAPLLGFGPVDVEAFPHLVDAVARLVGQELGQLGPGPVVAGAGEGAHRVYTRRRAWTSKPRRS